jgi:hypothetical protein
VTPIAAERFTRFAVTQKVNVHVVGVENRL